MSLTPNELQVVNALKRAQKAKSLRFTGHGGSTYKISNKNWLKVCNNKRFKPFLRPNIKVYSNVMSSTVNSTCKSNIKRNAKENRDVYLQVICLYDVVCLLEKNDVCPKCNHYLPCVTKTCKAYHSILSHVVRTDNGVEIEPDDSSWLISNVKPDSKTRSRKLCKRYGINDCINHGIVLEDDYDSPTCEESLDSECSDEDRAYESDDDSYRLTSSGSVSESSSTTF